MDYKKILIRTGILTLVVWGVFFILGLIFGWFRFECPGCAAGGAVFIAYSFILLPLWMLVVFGMVFFIEWEKHKKQV